MAVPAIHFYNTDTGFLHYVSKVVPRLESCVYDAVRDATDLSPKTALYIPNASMPSPLPLRALAKEALAVSAKAVEWMENLQRGSPFRDHEAWEREGRKKFVAERMERRKRLLAGEDPPSPNQF